MENHCQLQPYEIFPVLKGMLERILESSIRFTDRYGCQTWLVLLLQTMKWLLKRRTENETKTRCA